MKRLRISLVSLAVLAHCHGPATAQEHRPPPAAPASSGASPGAPHAVPVGAGEIRGTVVDAATGRPVAGASVSVTGAADSLLAGGAVTRGDGVFRVRGLRPGAYRVRVSHMGHAPLVRADVALSDAAPAANLGRVALEAAGVALEGLSVTAEASPVGMAADRNTYAVRDLPAAAGGSAADVLRNVPALEVDPDGRVSLRGSSNVVVQVNGRAVPMRGDQLGQFLQQLPAGGIDRVEVIPNPSARYDPEGLAGIVNVVLKGNADLGLSGGGTLTGATGERYTGSGNLGWQRGPLTLFGSAGVNDEPREGDGFMARENLFEGASSRFVDQWTRTRNGMRGRTVNASAELKVSPTSSLAATFMGADRRFTADNRISRVARDADGEVVSGSADRLGMRSDDLLLDGALSFRRVVEARRDETSAEVRYNRLEVDLLNAFAVLPLDAGGQPAGAPAESRRVLDARNGELAGQVDVTRMLGGVRLEVGAKGTRREVTNEAAETRLEGATWVPRPEQSYTFGTTETVQAGYAVLTRASGPWEVQGGLRVERTARGFRGIDADDVSHVDLFPSALAAYTLGGSRQVKVSYSRRVQRPQIQMLNSFLFYEDPLNRMLGNPRLRPELTDAVEAGFQQSGRLGSVQLTPFYRRTTGAIRRVRTLQGDTTTAQFQNVARVSSYGMDATATLRSGPLNGFVGLNAYQQETDGAALGGSVSNAGLGWAVRANATVALGPRTDLQAFGVYRAPMEVAQGRMGAHTMTTFSLRRKVMGERGSLTLRVTDPFDTMKSWQLVDARAEEQPYEMETERSFGLRNVALVFAYGFGRAPRITAPRPAEPQAEGGG
jgi:outer membrane receptor protein involved in Fe transport